MKFQKLFFVLVLSLVCPIAVNVFAEDLQIDGGKNYKINYRGSVDNSYLDWYDDTVVYDNVNIGAATKIVLNNELEYVYLGKTSTTTYENREKVVAGSTQTITVQDEIVETTYKYRKDENISTLAINQGGTLTLNAGSELSIRNEYSLVTSANDVDLAFNEKGELAGQGKTIFNEENVFEYKGAEDVDYVNKKIISQATSSDLFTGDIIFGVGDTDTVLTFQKVANIENEDFILPQAKEEAVVGATASGGDRIERDSIEDKTEGSPNELYNHVNMNNNFIINSNRAVFNVEGSLVSLKGDISGDGVVVKSGAGEMNLSSADATGLTGNNNINGYGWSIEQGTIIVQEQKNIGNSGINIKNGILRISNPSGHFVNDIKFSGETGSLILAEGSNVTLEGNLSASNVGKTAKILLEKRTNLILDETGETSIKGFNIGFLGMETYLESDVSRLATDFINAVNVAEKEREFASFELVLKEDEDKEYKGSLQGEMYLRKTGSGLVTLSGNSSYTKGTYITEGGLLLADSNALGTGKVMFDGGVISDTTTYASIGVSSITVGDINLRNNIHVKTGAILNVAENQNMYLLGDLVSYDGNYETNFIKNGLGNVIVTGKVDESRKINISSFTVTEGGFTLDNGVVLDSYFSLNGKQAYLKMNEGAGVKNNIDIFSGDLIIFNEHNISSTTFINFHNESTSTATFSKLHTTSNTVLTDNTVTTQINIKKNIEFVTEATTTVNFGIFNFEAGSDAVIVKSGDGKFVADNNGTDFDINSLYLNGGTFRLENANITVSSTTLIDGGILAISSSSHFASTASSAEDKKITVLNGGISIYDDNSIDGQTKLSFEGTDKENLSKLIIEAADVNLTNDIYVKTGVIIENEKDLTFSGDSIEGEYGILAKSGLGTMTINSVNPFEMGEIRALEGNLLVKSDIDVSTVSISGQKAILSFDNVNNAMISNVLSINNNGLLSLTNSNLNTETINVINSTMTLRDAQSNINAKNINVSSASLIYGIGNYNSTINMQAGSVMCIGKDHKVDNTTDDMETLNAKNVVFEKDSTLKIDIKNESGITSSDKLILSGDINVKNGAILDVNLLAGSTLSDFATTKSFEFINYSGNSIFENSSNEIFKILLNNPKLSASTALNGKSILLQIVKIMSHYEVPGMTKNQTSVNDVLNAIKTDETMDINTMKETLQKMNSLYGTYEETGEKAPFIDALQDLSGIFYTNSFMASAMLSKVNIVYNRLNDYSKERELGNRIWAQVYTNNFTVSESEENPEFENNIYGMIAGYDTVNEDNLVFGVSGFYGQGQLKQLEDKADIADAGLNVYGNYKIGEKIDIKGLIGYSSQNFDTTRNLRFINQEIKSNYATNTVDVDLEAAYRFDIGNNFSFKPFVGANCAVVSNGDIKEDGNAEQRLKIDKNSYTKADVRLGVGLQSRAVSPFNWYLSAVVKQTIIGDKFTTKASFIDAPGYDFEIESTKLATTNFGGNIGCSYDISSSFNISLDLSADNGSGSMFGGNIGASYRW